LTELGHHKNRVVSSQVAEGYVVKLSSVSHLLVKHGFGRAGPEIVSRCVNRTGEAVVVVDGSHDCLENKREKLLWKLMEIVLD